MTARSRTRPNLWATDAKSAHVQRTTRPTAEVEAAKPLEISPRLQQVREEFSVLVCVQVRSKSWEALAFSSRSVRSPDE